MFNPLKFLFTESKSSRAARLVALESGGWARWTPRDYAALGLVYGLHLLTHMPVGYLFTYTLAAYAVLWAIRARDSRIVFRVGGGMALGLLLSATYWLPAAALTKDTFEAYYRETFPYHNQYISPLPGIDAGE